MDYEFSSTMMTRLWLLALATRNGNNLTKLFSQQQIFASTTPSNLRSKGRKFNALNVTMVRCQAHVAGSNHSSRQLLRHASVTVDSTTNEVISQFIWVRPVEQAEQQTWNLSCPESLPSKWSWCQVVWTKLFQDLSQCLLIHTQRLKEKAAIKKQSKTIFLVSRSHYWCGRVRRNSFCSRLWLGNEDFNWENFPNMHRWWLARTLYLNHTSWVCYDTMTAHTWDLKYPCRLNGVLNNQTLLRDNKKLADSCFTYMKGNEVM